jgi:hypothetical protein
MQHLTAPAALTALAGACLCLAVQLPGPVRHWGPQAVALAVMLLMTAGASPGALTDGATAVAAACVWTAFTGSAHGRAATVVDLAAMALITALAAGQGGSGAPVHPASTSTAMPMAAGSAPHGLMAFLLLTGCWAAARVGVPLTALLGTSSPAARSPGRSPVRPGLRGTVPRGVLLRELGGGAMVIGMAAMFG